MNGGDLTRSTFKAFRHYSGVRMQQGRVQLDADWNEQLDVDAHRDRAESVDVVGPTGFPKAGGGFELTVSPDGRDLLVSAGRAWIGGLLCEVDAETTDATEVSSTSVQVTSLVLDGVEIAPDTWVEVLSDAASVVARTTAVDVAANTLTLDSSIGSLSGDLRLRRRSSYAIQPDLPEPEHTTQASPTDPRVLDLPNGSYLSYLDVWERAITALDDPAISEPALGVDTATRTRVVWQLRLLDLAGVPEPITCDSDLTGAQASLAAPSGLMAAQAEPPAGSADLCRPTPAGGYVGLENQLYRVHVHDIDSGRPVILWSRENASVATTWVATITSDVLQVASIGRDAVLGFQPGDWVELYDDTCVLHGRPGTLVRLLNAREDRLTLDPTTATGSTDIADFPRNAQVRRWDSEGAVPVTGGGWIDLENGVQVRFSGGTYRRHDYWLVPARSVTADVDWPRDSGGEPLLMPPAGIHRPTGKVGIVTRTDEGLAVADCRDLFPSLTTLTANDVTVANDACQLPGVETVQDAIDVLCQSHDLRRHHRLLHGYGIVCGLVVHCGEDEVGEARRARERFTTVERRAVFKTREPDDLRAEPSLRERLDLDRIDVAKLRETVARRFVTVNPGTAIDADGYDLELTEPLRVDVLAEAEALGDGILDENGDGEVCLVLRNNLGRGPVVAATPYIPGERWDSFQGTLLYDIYEHCIASLYRWVKAQLNPPKRRDAKGGQPAYLLRTALTNLLTYVANPNSGANVFVGENEHEQLVRFYDGLKKRLRSKTFCAMFDDARPYPDYPESLKGVRTISGCGTHSRLRVHPSGREAWTTGGGVNPLKQATMINRYSLPEERLVARVDPVSGSAVETGGRPSSTAAAVTDIAFSPDGRLVYVAVPTRDGNDTLFRVGEIGETDIRWRPATTICGVKLVTLATTQADPNHVYAVGLRRTSTAGKAFGLREYTGAGIWRIPAKEVPEGLGPLSATAGLNTVGHLVISPKGEAVFTCGAAGATAERYDRLVTMTVPDDREPREIVLDGSGADDLTLVLGTDRVPGTSAWAVVGAGGDRQVAGFDVATGEQVARVPVGGAGRLSLHGVNDRIVVTDSNSSVARVLNASRSEFLDRLMIPVQVAPSSVSATYVKTRHVVVLNLVSNSVTAIDAGIVMGDELDLSPLVRYRRDAVEAFADLVGGLLQYLKDCICDHVLVNCPPEPVNKDLDLAAVSIRGGSVYKVCNFSRRRYVKSFPTVGYWLSLVPVIPALRELIGQACCAVLPEVFGTYSTTGRDDDDRVDAARVLRFLELAQDEDPLTRLKNLDWGFLASFFKGINEGDWGETQPTAEPTPFEPAEPAGGNKRRPHLQPDEPVSEPITSDKVVKASAPELVFRNLLMNPAIKRDLSGEVFAQPAQPEAATAEGPGPHPGQFEALLARVESLETELASLKKTRTRTRRSTEKPTE